MSKHIISVRIGTVCNTGKFNEKGFPVHNDDTRYIQRVEFDDVLMGGRAIIPIMHSTNDEKLKVHLINTGISFRLCFFHKTNAGDVFLLGINLHIDQIDLSKDPSSIPFTVEENKAGKGTEIQLPDFSAFILTVERRREGSVVGCNPPPHHPAVIRYSGPPQPAVPVQRAPPLPEQAEFTPSPVGPLIKPRAE